MDAMKEIIGQIEHHSVDRIKSCFARGVDPNSIFRGEPLLHELTSEYTRSPNFKECVKAFVDHGLNYDDKVLLSVLLDDAATLGQHLTSDGSLAHKKYSLRCAYTPLHEASLLHICAEFNQVDCAKLLLKHGLDVNVIAGVDEFGFGGQTPIFHTVNQNGHQSKDMMYLLLEHGASLDITVKGLVWGKGYEWETFIPAVNPLSYAMMGLLPQMHRNEKIIADVVSVLMKHAYGIDYTPENVPNAYLK